MRRPGERGGPAVRPSRSGRRGALLAALLAGLLAACLLPSPAGAQTLAERVTGMGDGVARLSFATRPEVRICEGGIRMGTDRHVRWSSGGRHGEAGDCRPGPATLELRVRAGRVSRVEILHLHDPGAAGARELGTVPPGEAVDLLASVARESGRSAAEDAVFPMTLADVDRVWERLLEIARDGGLLPDVRKSALFWLGQEAAEAATAGLAEVAGGADEEQEVREAAVFALSQRPEGEGVPALMELARSADQAETRRSALFWLAQSDAPEVVDFFAAILRGGGGR